jgi:hypothetical protein
MLERRLGLRVGIYGHNFLRAEPQRQENGYSRASVICAGAAFEFHRTAVLFRKALELEDTLGLTSFPKSYPLFACATRQPLTWA